MTTPTQQGLTACPSCGAAVRPGSDWCTLCFTDLRPVPAPVQSAPLPVMRTPEASAPADPAAPGTEPAAPKLIPCRSCGSDMDPMVGVCPTCGIGLFDSLARETRHTVELPFVGDVMRYSRNTRMAAAAIGSSAFAGIIVVVVGFVAKLF